MPSPREGFLADEGIGPYDLLPAFQRKILAQGKILKDADILCGFQVLQTAALGQKIR